MLVTLRFYSQTPFFVAAFAGGLVIKAFFAFIRKSEATRANRTAKGSICRVSAVFAEIKAAFCHPKLDKEKRRALVQMRLA